MRRKGSGWKPVPVPNQEKTQCTSRSETAHEKMCEKPPIRDRNDVIVLCTALSGEADVLCSADGDLFELPASILLASYGIDVLTDVELMRKLRE